jgi:hypothetical protein
MLSKIRQFVLSFVHGLLDKGPVHEHTMCKNCAFIRTDKVGILDVDLYICHEDDSDLWTYVRVYGSELEQHSTSNGCI